MFLQPFELSKQQNVEVMAAALPWTPLTHAHFSKASIRYFHCSESIMNSFHCVVQCYLSKTIVPVHVRQPKGVVTLAVTVLDGQPPGHPLQAKVDHVPPKSEELVVVRGIICVQLHEHVAVSKKFTFNTIPYPGKEVNSVNNTLHQLVELLLGESQVVIDVDIVDSGGFRLLHL